MISTVTSELLENLILKHGQIVTTQQIFSEASVFMNHKQTEYLITTLTKNGWLMRIKKGIYAISDLSTRGVFYRFLPTLLLICSSKIRMYLLNQRSSIMACLINLPAK